MDADLLGAVFDVLQRENALGAPFHARALMAKSLEEGNHSCSQVVRNIPKGAPIYPGRPLVVKGIMVLAHLHFWKGLKNAEEKKISRYVDFS